ncbi:hypothetical protein [Vreelandella titanicae]|uniref:Uncharacterized protein n=1 Tax=Vreelandella titanicae TaxID=664683 RepID=A0AAP9T2Q6_9GAMM|nr:hypothetical protein [Halomonas titanicae]QKS26600.1 hypothetical protein FX987_04409 [Halomonas titanicae]
MVNPSQKLTRFTYRLHQDKNGDHYAWFEIRSQNRRAKIGLLPSETEELWITYAEMPHSLAHMVDDRTWDAHRKPILEMLAAHYLPPSH